MAQAYDPYTNVIHTMTKAMETGHIDQSMFEILKNPQRETKVYLPIEMDDGSVRVKDIEFSIPIYADRSKEAFDITRPVI